jgi:hypothetical protein
VWCRYVFSQALDPVSIETGSQWMTPGFEPDVDDAPVELSVSVVGPPERQLAHPVAQPEPEQVPVLDLEQQALGVDKSVATFRPKEQYQGPSNVAAVSSRPQSVLPGKPTVAPVVAPEGGARMTALQRLQLRVEKEKQHQLSIRPKLSDESLAKRFSIDESAYVVSQTMDAVDTLQRLVH